MKRKAWGSFFSPQIAKMCSLGPKKAPPDLTFHKGFAKLATLTEKCSPGDQFGLTIVDPNQFSKKRKIVKNQSKWSIYSCSKSIFQKKYFLAKSFSIWKLYSNAKSMKFILQKNHNIFSISKANRSSILIFHFKFILKFDFSIWNSYFPSKLIFFRSDFFPSEKSIWSFYFPSKNDFLFCNFAKN